MTSRSFLRRAGAFTLIELLVVIAIIALLVAILLPALGEARRTAKQAQNVSNLKQWMTALYSYSSEFKDIMPSFNWRTGQREASNAGLPAGGDLEAAASQAVDIFRRRAPNYTDFPVQTNWIPHILYNHLVLLDYLAARLPEPMVRSPEDRLRALWAERVVVDHVGLNAELLASGLTPNPERWPFSSSYSPTLCMFTPDKESFDGGYLRSAGWGLFEYSAGSNGGYRLGGRKLSEVQFPAQKVALFENIQRHVGKVPMPFVYYGARITCATFDGRVTVLDMSRVNKGGYTRANASNANPNSATSAAIDYPVGGRPPVGDPPWPGDSGLAGAAPPYFRHTIGGLKGVDIGGNDIYRHNVTYPPLP